MLWYTSLAHATVKNRPPTRWAAPVSPRAIESWRAFAFTMMPSSQDIRRCITIGFRAHRFGRKPSILKRRDVRVVVRLRGYAATARHLAVARAEISRERRRMKEHAWKSTLAARADAHQILRTHFPINNFRYNDLRWHVAVSDVVPRGLRRVCDTVLTQSGIRFTPTHTEDSEPYPGS
jgi:hypothetical protein